MKAPCAASVRCRSSTRRRGSPPFDGSRWRTLGLLRRVLAGPLGGARTATATAGPGPAGARTSTKEVTNKMISFQSAEKDLALMSLCSGGVLSNSTFAWWGAFFGQNKLGYVAPRYWSGWASEIWNPSRIQSFFMTHIMDVMDSRDSGK